MASERLLQGLIASRRVQMLTNLRVTQVAASTTDAILAKFVLPCTCTLARIDYSMTVGGAGTGGDWVNDVVAKVGTDAVSEELDDLDAAEEKTGSMAILKPATQYAAGTVVQITGTTVGDSTIDAIAFTLSIVPVNP